jgi:hypothetical protein
MIFLCLLRASGCKFGNQFPVSYYVIEKKDFTDFTAMMQKMPNIYTGSSQINGSGLLHPNSFGADWHGWTDTGRGQ